MNETEIPKDIKEINARLEKLNQRVIRKENILIFDFNTLYNDSLFILSHYFKNYKSKLIPERGVNFAKFNDHELTSYIADMPYFNALVNWIDIDTNPDSEEQVNDFLEISKRLLSVLYNPEKSELFHVFKTFYELGSVTIIGVERSDENARDLSLFHETKFEKCSITQLFEPSFVLQKVKEHGATLVIHPSIRTLTCMGHSVYDLNFMYPIIGYNYVDGYGLFREPVTNRELEKQKIDYGHEFIEYWPFDIDINAIGYGYSKDPELMAESIAYQEKRAKEKEMEEKKNDANHSTE